jgi:amino acid transporter
MTATTNRIGVQADSVLDATTAADDEYLRELGYEPRLTRALGLFSSFSLQFGQIAPLGGIVFTLAVGLVAVGPAIMWPWLIAGALQVLVSVLVAEACSAYPVAGGAYNIVSRRGGRFLGWQTGWWIELAHIMSVSSSCIGITPVILAWAGVTPSHWQTVGIAAGLILISTLINLAAVKVTSGMINASAVATMLACALVTLGTGAALLFGSHHANGVSTLFTTSGQIKGSIVLPLLYAALLPAIVINGFDVSGNAGEETKDASRAIPRAMIRANVASYGFGTVMILVLLLAMGRLTNTLAATQPVTYILNPVIGHALAKGFEVIAVVGLYVSAVVLQMAGARVLWAQGRDNKLPFASFFTHLNKEHVPSYGLWFTAVVAVLATLWSSLYVVLIAMTVVLWVAGYGVLLTVMWIGRLRGTVSHGAFQAPAWRIAYPVAIIWSALLCAVLIYQNPRQVGVGLLIAAVAGLVVYQFLPKAAPADAPALSLSE